jgi:hypothetical protein
MNIYNTTAKRIAMRFVEIFIISGAVGLLESTELASLIPPIFIGVVAAVLKAIREWQDSKRNQPANQPL